MQETIAIACHPYRGDAIEAADRMTGWLRDAGLRVIFPQKGEDAETCRLVVTFGGDGTMLSGARSALRYRCPLLGINLGTVGFLTEAEPIGLEELRDAILERAYVIEPRSLLEVRVNDSPERFLALNDAVVTRGGFARLIQVETRISGSHWGTFIADGVIAATPTGSTGYSLSAGGPVIAPGVECMAITPVCAHSLQHSPCVVPTESEVVFHLRSDRDQRAELQIDGRSVTTLGAGDTVYVTGAEEKLRLARIGSYPFFEVLQNKLNEWSRPGKEESR